jgi:hypothetical protein
MTCDASSEKVIIGPFKRNDTFVIACVYKESGIGSDVTAYTIRSQLRNSLDSLVEELVVAKADQTISPGFFTLTAPSTASWPIDMLRCDIQISSGTSVRSTKTFFVSVEGDITRE